MKIYLLHIPVLNDCILSNGNCSHVCIEEKNGRRCSCHEGYEIHTDGKYCISK